MKIISSVYHALTFEGGRDRYIQKTVEVLECYPQDVGIVFTGISGMLVGMPAADKTGRPFAIVRKDREECHSSCKVEGVITDRYIIVDDFVSSGQTLKRIMNIMEPFGSECIGVILYAGSKSDSKWLQDNDPHFKTKDLTFYELD